MRTCTLRLALWLSMKHKSTTYKYFSTAQKLHQGDQLIIAKTVIRRKRLHGVLLETLAHVEGVTSSNPLLLWKSKNCIDIQLNGDLWNLKRFPGYMYNPGWIWSSWGGDSDEEHWWDHLKSSLSASSAMLQERGQARNTKIWEIKLFFKSLFQRAGAAQIRNSCRIW